MLKYLAESLKLGNLNLMRFPRLGCKLMVIYKLALADTLPMIIFDRSHVYFAFSSAIIQSEPSGRLYLFVYTKQVRK